MKFLLFLFVVCLIFFSGVFQVGFFADDFFLLKVGQASSLSQFVDFFNTSKIYGFYRPVSTEFFYFLINQTGRNVLIGHLISFATFFTGVYFLFKSLKTIFENELLSKIILTLYALSFIHVYQIYWLAAYQEVAMFCFLMISFYTFLRKKIILSFLFFVLALLSREQAAIFPVFLFFFILLKRDYFKRESLILIGSMFATSLLFGLIYRSNYQIVAKRAEYQLHLSPKLIINNFMWYFLWAIGLPSILPDFLPSVFSKPLPGLWRFFADPVFKIYVFSLGVYLVLLLIGFIKTRPFKIAVACLFFFGLFVIPMTPIVHKWMLRLTVPLIFISVFEGFIIYSLIVKKGVWRYMGLTLIALYLSFNFFGIKFHEKASTYLFETAIAREVGNHLKNGNVYFADSSKLESGWQGSQKLKLTLADQSFLNYFYPNGDLKAVYQFENPKKPNGYYIIDSQKLIEEAAKNVD